MRTGQHEMTARCRDAVFDSGDDVAPERRVDPVADQKPDQERPVLLHRPGKQIRHVVILADGGLEPLAGRGRKLVLLRLAVDIKRGGGQRNAGLPRDIAEFRPFVRHETPPLPQLPFY